MTKLVNASTHSLVACEIFAEAQETNLDREYRCKKKECVLCEVQVKAETTERVEIGYNYLGCNVVHSVVPANSPLGHVFLYFT